jgi:hypothetical protein
MAGIVGLIRTWLSRALSTVVDARDRLSSRVFKERSGFLVGALLFTACGSSLPLPITGPHPAQSTAYAEVPFPPPPAQVEIVPPRPKEAGAVWVDGEWAWQGRGWAWLPGGWVVPPPRSYFAPWLVYRLDDGRLLFAPGAWHAVTGERLPNPVVLEAARNGLQQEEAPSARVPAGPGSAP